jgi:hypothetical protein
MNWITWTPELFNKFKRHYNNAARNQAVSFNFEGQEFLVSYAKYLIEFLEPKMRK